MRTGRISRYCLLSLGLAFTALLLAVSCSKPDPPPYVSPDVAIINANPTEYTGDNVTLSGSVREVRTTGIFVLGSLNAPKMASMTPINQILIVPDRDAIIPPLKVGDLVEVAGYVALFTAGMEETGPAFGHRGREVSPSFYSQWQNRSCVVTKTIKKLEYPPGR